MKNNFLGKPHGGLENFIGEVGRYVGNVVDSRDKLKEGKEYVQVHYSGSGNMRVYGFIKVIKIDVGNGEIEALRWGIKSLRKWPCDIKLDCFHFPKSNKTEKNGSIDYLVELK